MAFEGDLRHLSLGDVLQTLAMSRQVGTFIVRSPSEERRLAVGPAGCGLLNLRPSLRVKVAAWLRGRGRVSDADFQAAVQSQKRRKDTSLEEILLDAGAITPEDVAAARSYICLEEIFDLFLWKEGSFEFVSAEGGDPPQPYSGSWSDVMSLAMEAARRMDEMEHLREAVPPDVILCKTDPAAGDPDPAEVGDDALSLYRMIDGTRTVEAIFEEFHLGRFDTWKHLVSLAEKGYIRPAGVDEMAAAASELLGAKQHEKAAALLQRIVDLDPSDVEAQKAYVQALVAAGDKRSAAAQFVRKGIAELGDGQPTAAAESFAQAARLDNGNVDAVEGLARSHFANGDPKAGAEAARQASSLRLEAGDHVGAAEIAEIGIRECPDDVHLRIALANARIAAGDAGDGLLMLNDAASLLEASGDDERRLIEVYKRILQLDPARKDCAKRIEQIQESERVRRRRTMQRVSIAAAVVILACLAIPIVRGAGLERRVADAQLLAETDAPKALAALDAILQDELSEDDDMMVRAARHVVSKKITPPGKQAAEILLARLTGTTTLISTQVGRDYARALEAVSSALDLIDSPEAKKAETAMGEELAKARAEAQAEIEACLQSLASDAMTAAGRISNLRDRIAGEAMKREETAILTEVVEETAGVAKLAASQDWNTIAQRAEAVWKRRPRPKDSVDTKTLSALKAIIEDIPLVANEGARANAALQKRRLIEMVVSAGRQGQSLLLEGHVEEAADQYRSVVEFADSLAKMQPKELYAPIVREYLGKEDITRTHREQLARIEVIRRNEEEAATALAAGDVPRAYHLRAALVRDYPRVDFRQRFRLPVRVESQPPGADVEISYTPEAVPGDEGRTPESTEPQIIGRTPIPVLEIPIDGHTRLRLMSRGFEPGVVERHGAADDGGAFVTLELKKIALFTSQRGGAVEAAATGGDGVVFIAGRDGIVRAIAASDGHEVARRALGTLDGVAGSAALADGRLVVAALDGALVQLDPKTLDETARGTLSGGARGSLVSTPHGVVVASETGTVQMLNSLLKPKWTQKIGKVVTDPAAANGRIAIVEAQGELVLLDAATGVIESRLSLPDDPRWTGPAAAGSYVVTGGDACHVVCADSAAKRIAWTIEVDGQVTARPAIVGNRVVVATTNGAVHILDVADGRRITRISVGAPVRQAVLPLADGFVVATERGGIVRFDAGGNVIWRYDIKDDLLAPPSLVGGRVIVVSRKGVAHGLEP